MKFTWILAVAVVFGMGLARMSFGADETKEFFPIIPWDGAPNDPAALARIKECGFTVAGFCSLKQLEEVQKAGLKAMLADPRTSGYAWRNVDPAAAKKNVQALVDELGNYRDTVFAFHLQDEPATDGFSGLATVTSAVREIAKDKIAFVNLLPNYATNEQLGAKSYEEYLDRFANEVKPMVLCYDHYALLDNGGLRDEYFQNLEQMRAAGKKHKLAFWNCVLAVGHFNYRVPNEADFRFQAYTTLMYGGRGLIYFKYVAPDVGNYRSAPIDQFGHETPTWTALRFANLEVQKLAPTMLKLSSDDVYHFGKKPKGTHGPGEKSLVKEMNAGEFAVGDFTHEDGSRYVMIVNRDVTHSMPAFPTWRTAPKKVSRISSYTGQAGDFTGEQVWLAPGQGVLLKVE